MKLQWLYGTAWKKEKTRDLVLLAVQQGFRAIDTANQAKHYNEPAVGEALAQLVDQGISRDELFIQTKFTPVDGQDHRLPYDPKAKVADQVLQSFESSLSHLGLEWVDSYLLHGPYHHPHLGEEDYAVWETLEQIEEEGGARHIGISNVNPMQLAELLQKARIFPDFVQNRCYASRGWDRTVREICQEFGIRYQGFSLLTANGEYWEHPALTGPAQRLGVTPAQIIFRFAHQVNLLPLTGTSNAEHMTQDLGISQFQLTADEVNAIDAMGDGN